LFTLFFLWSFTEWVCFLITSFYLILIECDMCVKFCNSILKHFHSTDWAEILHTLLVPLSMQFGINKIIYFFKMTVATKWRIGLFFIIPLIWASNERARWTENYKIYDVTKKIKMADVPRWRITFFLISLLIWVSNERTRRVENDKMNDVIRNPKWNAYITIV
jgi:hypothetical protein